MDHSPASIHDSIATIRVGAMLDFRSAQSFKDACEACVEEGARHFIVDFEHTRVLDSMGLGALFTIYKMVAPFDGVVALSTLAGSVKTVVEMTRVYKIFPVYESAVTASRDIRTMQERRASGKKAG